MSLKKWEHILRQGSFLVSLANKAHLSVEETLLQHSGDRIYLVSEAFCSCFPYS